MLTSALCRLKHISPRGGFLLVGLAAWGITIAGLVLTHWEQLQPCQLCIFQRLLFMLIGTLALLAAAVTRSGESSSRTLGFILALPCLLGFGVAIYQTLMQSVPGLVSECNRADPGLIEDFVDWLGIEWMVWIGHIEWAANIAFLRDLFLATGQCASKEWVFLGLSLANWAALFFCLFTLFVLWVSGWFGRDSHRL